MTFGQLLNHFQEELISRDELRSAILELGLSEEAADEAVALAEREAKEGWASLSDASAPDANS